MGFSNLTLLFMCAAVVGFTTPNVSYCQEIEDQEAIDEDPLLNPYTGEVVDPALYENDPLYDIYFYELIPFWECCDDPLLDIYTGEIIDPLAYADPAINPYDGLELQISELSLDQAFFLGLMPLPMLSYLSEESFDQLISYQVNQ